MAAIALFQSQFINSVILLILIKFCLMQGSRVKKVGKYLIYLNQALGKGTFGQVFRAKQYLPLSESNEKNQQRKDVAVKILSKQQVQKDLRTKNAFRNELSIMKKIKNTYVIEFYDHLESKTSHYIFLELAEGGTLRTRLRMNGGRFDQQTTRRILGQIVNGFGQLAKHGILHRDLKPENILIKDNTIKIADFGFAKISENNSFFTSGVGTPVYMAPQILSGKRYTYKCDIWSLGVITYQMMFGRKPWHIQQNSFDGLRKQITTRKIMFPDNIEATPKIKQFILGCLQIDEDTRYDWDQIFSHPIFKGKLLPYFDGKKQGETIINFIMSDFRCNIYSNNISLKEILNRLQGGLTKADFFTLMTYVDKSLSPQNAALLFNYIVNRDGYIDLEDLRNLFIKYGCLLAKIEPSQIQVQEGSDPKEGMILMTRLKRRMQKKKWNINQLLTESNYQKENIMNFKDFSEYILKIDPYLNINQIDCLFKIFDLNGDGKISQSQLQAGMCKIDKIATMEDEQ